MCTKKLYRTFAFDSDLEKEQVVEDGANIAGWKVDTFLEMSAKGLVQYRRVIGAGLIVRSKLNVASIGLVKFNRQNGKHGINGSLSNCYATVIALKCL